MSLDGLAYVPLLFGPSPVHRLERLSEHLGGEVEIWAKREDCNSGLAYGGNKVRKLEYLAADAVAQGCDTLVSIGGVQSNHTRQVAAVAATSASAASWSRSTGSTGPMPSTTRSATSCSRGSWAPTSGSIRPASTSASGRAGRRRSRRSRQRGGKPYAIPAGASDHPLGGLGFARWAQEVAEQEAELGVFFDTIVVCSVTGSTQAGMIAGFAAAGRGRASVLGIDGSATVEQTWEQIARIARPHGRGDRPRPRAPRRRDRPARRVARRHVRHPGREDDRGDPPVRPPRGRAHRSGVRGKVDGGADRPGAQRPHRARITRPVRTSRRPAGAERLLRRLLTL